MFTPTPVNKIAAAYLGNPQPLAQKVEKDKQQNGGIPRDLRQLLALNDITQGRNAAGIQQALQTPTDMPTVAQSLQERARQAIQAQMMQQAQQQQRKEGLPMAVPPNAPRPPMQAQGIDNLPTNIGEGYAGGGIIGFTNGGNIPSSGELAGFSGPTPEEEAKAELRAAEQERVKKLVELKQKADFLKSAGAPQAQEVEMQLQALKDDMRPKPSPTDPNFRRQPDPRMTGTPAVSSSVPLVTSGDRPPSANVNASAARDSAPMPGGLTDLAKLPSVGVGRDFLQRSLASNEKFDEEALKQKYLKEVGAKDTSIYDEMAAELKARKERLNAPKQGYEALMEYLGQIAQAGGRNWTQSGAIGASRVNALQKERQTQQDALMEKILDLGAKKKEAQYNERLGMFNLTKAEKDKINKESREIATALNLSEIEAEKMRQQAIENELNRKNQIRAASIGAQDRDQLMNRARALMAVDKTLTLEEAMQRAALAAGAASLEGLDVRRLGEYNKAKKEIQSRYPQALLNLQNPTGEKMRAELAAELKQARLQAGLPDQGIDTLPGASSSGKVPAVGAVMNGYKFKGGNPADKNNWEKV